MNARLKLFIFISVISVAFILIAAGCGKNPEASNEHLKMGIDLVKKGKLDDAMNEYNHVT